MSADPKIIRDWLKALGVLTAGNMSLAEVAAKVAANAALLSAYPAWAFSPGSLDAMAREFKFFPSYAELSESLRYWARDNAPPQMALPSNAPAGWSDDDEVWFRYWHRRAAEGFTPLTGLAKPPSGLSWRAHVASLVRSKSGAAWARIAAGSRA